MDEEDHTLSRKRAVIAAIPPVAFVTLLWCVLILESTHDWSFHALGIQPGHWEGLLGILTTPLVHGSVEHLLNNSAPLLVLGWTLFYFYSSIALRALIFIQLFSGFWVWLFARPSVHIGASGLVYGLAAFIFLSGILRNERRLISISLLVAFLYGSMFWGVFPIRAGVSWESHLWGGIAGAILAVYYRKEGPQRPLYEWEREEMEMERERERWRNARRTGTTRYHVRPERPKIVYHYKEKGRNEQKGKE